MSRATRCKHFTGIQHMMCSAGVIYSTVRDSSKSPYEFPCLEPSCTKCEKREYPTPEEVAAEEAEFKKIVDEIMGTRAAIVEHAQGKRGVRGKLSCPVCSKGMLHYSIAGCNGHIHAKCETKDCVAFME